jgi:hypothetical protein
LEFQGAPARRGKALAARPPSPGTAKAEPLRTDAATALLFDGVAKADDITVRLRRQARR